MERDQIGKRNAVITLRGTNREKDFLLAMAKKVHPDLFLTDFIWGVMLNLKKQLK